MRQLRIAGIIPKITRLRYFLFDCLYAAAAQTDAKGVQIYHPRDFVQTHSKWSNFTLRLKFDHASRLNLLAAPPAKSALKFNPSHDLRAKTRLHMPQKHRVIKIPLVPRRIVGGDEACRHDDSAPDICLVCAKL